MAIEDVLIATRETDPITVALMIASGVLGKEAEMILSWWPDSSLMDELDKLHESGEAPPRDPLNTATEGDRKAPSPTREAVRRSRRPRNIGQGLSPSARPDGLTDRQWIQLVDLSKEIQGPNIRAWTTARGGILVTILDADGFTRIVFIPNPR